MIHNLKIQEEANERQIMHTVILAGDGYSRWDFNQPHTVIHYSQHDQAITI
jgi:hypothetical protein